MTAAVMSQPVLSFTEAQRRHPDDVMIARIRDRYPTEPEIDAVLTRKMRRRRGDPYKAVPIERLVAGVTAMIGEELGYEAQVSNARWLSGGASKLQMVFDLAWRGLDGQAPESVETLVLRMEPAASVTESSRRREFEVLNAVQGVIPAPRPYWVDPEARYLPYPGMVYAFAQGAAKPSVGVEKVSGLGQNYGPELRAKLAPHFVSLLARLHTVDPGKCTAMVSFMQAQAGSNASVIRQVNAYRRIWEEDRIEEEPFLEVVYQWLIAHAPSVDRPSIVHGDYRSGNFLFDEASGAITAWLDWEGAVIGDRHQDLTYATLPTFQHLSEDGGSVLASGMMSKDDFYAAYEAASGLPVDPVRIRYFEIFNRYLVCVLTLAASARASLQAGTHQDVLVNFVSQMGHTAIADLRERFLEVTR
ncbi:phosphotransferase family protein [Novosphingobium sp. fls2-241-R2A-195]|jgi:aminoglycoside phosphotransferase (APT) family kinase protein|uniref:phosphotransferase family protein n=1 Tax=Novosphingobium sp. fls2-241-R2A-195 TaxID=3040296 RepID=UPI002549E558|nr:phosphotransferase family protein [Novosphingobium sp. fls2-241-R2A-195]